MAEKTFPDARYWGKADPQFGERARHLLAFHALDVAAVMHTLLQQRPDLVIWFERALGLPAATVHPLLTWLALIHDSGKFAENFQHQREDLASAAGLKPRNSTMRHDVVGFAIWADELHIDQSDWLSRLQRVLDIKPAHWISLIHASTAHHGLPSDQAQSEFFHEAISPAGRAAALELASWGYSHFALHQITNTLPAPTDTASASWLLAGIVIYADWLGSSTTWFPYVADPEITLAHYWECVALPQAARAICESRSVPGAIATTHYYSAIGLNEGVARPGQRQAGSVELANGPQCFIIEDATGSGKTEAAMILALRLMQHGLGSGLFVALPTMATANGLFPRIHRYAEDFLATPDTAAIALAHSGARWMEWFARSIHSSADDGSQSAELRASGWINDHRKRALIAQIGVGTVDQLFLAVLKAKHNAIRLFGLFGKVLVVDEVHAYDAYQMTLLKTLLKAHRRQGGSAVLLSATLPLDIRDQLLSTYSDTKSDVNRDAYPLLSHAHSASLDFHPLQRLPDLLRRYRVRYLVEREAVINLLVNAARNGRCAVWIRNTVSDAMAAYAELKKALQAQPDIGLTLFHARFAFCDRLAREKSVLARFGKEGDPILRRGQILIATQVVEQSLDLDFDELVTDLAPIDLMIQRAGRLRRHRRDAQGHLIAGVTADARGEPTLTVYGPTREGEVQSNWYSRFSAGAAMVYKNHAQIWRSARALGDILDLTVDPRGAIEAVYASEECPSALAVSSDNALGGDYADRSTARDSIVALEKPFARQGNWNDDERALTRLGEPSVELALACIRDGRIQPWSVSGASEAENWALSVVRVRNSWANARAPLGAWEEQARALEETTSLRWRVLLLLHEEDSLLTANAQLDQKSIGFSYRAEVGLQKLKPRTHGMTT